MKNLKELGVAEMDTTAQREMNGGVALGPNGEGYTERIFLWQPVDKLGIPISIGPCGPIL